MTTVLAIESSCDETGIGIAGLAADGAVTLLADEVASSVDEHARFGGVVPEIASRAHLEALGPTMRRALDAAGIDKPDVVAATIGPWSYTSAARCPPRWLHRVERHFPGGRIRFRRSHSHQQGTGEPGPDGGGDDIGPARPAASSARRMVGPSASRCARDAISGTTPPNLACSSTLDATSSANRVTVPSRPSRRCRLRFRRRSSRWPGCRHVGHPRTGPCMV